MKRVVVLDTNVLLSDPNAVLSFPTAEVVIPETVLGELDKLKTARVDPDLRFRGREISRLLFELSEDGSLVDGVELADGGRLRVAVLDSDGPLPEGLQARNADDRILATAFQVCDAAAEGCDVTLVTNDLNMLLKAQTLGIPVERAGDGLEGSFARRYIIRPFQRYKVPIGILAVAIAVFAAVLVAIIISSNRPTGVASIPTEFKALLSVQQQRALDALVSLQASPNDPQALLAMGNFYFDAYQATSQGGDRVSALQSARQGVRYYERYLATTPTDNDARADLASLLFYAGQTDQAIQQVSAVLESDPDHVNGNFNLGIFFWQGRRDYDGAIDQMKKVITLTEDDPQQHSVLEQTRLVLERIENDAKSANGSTSTTGGATQ